VLIQQVDTPPVAGDEAELTAHQRIEERELEAGGRAGGQN
jgi:hypothetical protein